MKRILTIIGIITLSFGAGWFANDYYESLYSNITIKQLKNDQQENEKKTVDSLRSEPIDSLANSVEQRARKRFN